MSATYSAAITLMKKELLVSTVHDLTRATCPKGLVQVHREQSVSHCWPQTEWSILRVREYFYPCTHFDTSLNILPFFTLSGHMQPWSPLPPLFLLHGKLAHSTTNKCCISKAFSPLPLQALLSFLTHIAQLNWTAQDPGTCIIFQKGNVLYSFGERAWSEKV